MGQLMGKALMDGRTLDLPLSPALYRWLRGEERLLTLADVTVHVMEGQVGRAC
jgi:hypothetical protein